MRGVAMSLSNWDPLEEKLTSELANAAIKRQIKNILKSYTGWFDLFSELIQNALDALENRKNEEANFSPTMWIDINLKENTISLTDNGIGFSEDQFSTFLAPNVSFKGQENRGNKGVGATYLAYGFNFLQIGTKTPDFAFIGTLKHGRKWVEDEIKERPKVMTDDEPLHAPFKGIDRGSTFTLKLIGKYIRPKKLDWLSASSFEQWNAILRLKTPLGGIYFEKETPTFKCHLTVVDESGNKSVGEVDDCEYLYPHTVISTCIALDKIQAEQRSFLEKNKDVSKLPDKYKNLNGIYKYWTVEDVERDFTSKLDEDQARLIGVYKVSCYGFFCYSIDIWDSFNDEKLGIRKGEKILRGGLQLATNSMPQGELILIPLKRHMYYQNVSHVVVHFEKVDPDLGRKGFQPELEGLAKNIAVAAVNHFLVWRKYLRKETGASPDIVGHKNISDWIHDSVIHEKAEPLSILGTDVFLPTSEPSITSKPLNEQDVIALFNQLLAGGVIRGVRIMETSSYNQYDGIFRLCLKEPIGHYVYNKVKNPLGLRMDKCEPYLSAPQILEYKYSFDALIEEIEKDEKSEKYIELVIAWKMGDGWHARYEITPLLHFANIHHRYFHGGTHLIKNALTGDVVFPAIILSELIEYINAPDLVQASQEKIYTEV